MCGVAGIINKGSEDLADTLLDMLFCVRHRGLDATGVAVYENRSHVQARITMPDPLLLGELEALIKPFCTESEHRVYQGEGVFTFYDAVLKMDEAKIPELHRTVDAHPSFCVHSLSTRLSVYKDQGTSMDLKSRHEINLGAGSHGIGHVRMATESAEDINAAHPFISPLKPDLAMVHNGQFTNYFNLRRTLENKGVKFKTQNDSEMACHYIAWRMSEGRDLEGALHDALENLDGVFTIIASTPDQVGVVKDKLAIKPMLIFQRGGVTVFGSEQISLTPVFEDVFAEEMDPGEVRTWSV